MPALKPGSFSRFNHFRHLFLSHLFQLICWFEFDWTIKCVACWCLETEEGSTCPLLDGPDILRRPRNDARYLNSTSICIYVNHISSLIFTSYVSTSTRNTGQLDTTCASLNHITSNTYHFSPVERRIAQLNYFQPEGLPWKNIARNKSKQSNKKAVALFVSRKP